jgi:hypothetical protein
MSGRSSSRPDLREEWSVTLDGRYVVRFCGVNAQELATRQLHELAELLGFDDSPRHAAATRAGAEAAGDSSGAANTNSSRPHHDDAAQGAGRAKRRQK